MSFVERIKVTDGTEVASVNASNQLEVAEANSNAIKTAVELIDNAIAGSEMQVDVVASLPAGTNNIGDVDVLTVPAPLNVTGGGVESAALRVTIANNSTGVVSVDDNGSTLSVDDGGGSITVDNASLTALNDTITSIGGSTLPTKMVAVGGLWGTDETRVLQLNDDGYLITDSLVSNVVGHDNTASTANWFSIAGYASSSTPTAVAGGDYSRIWTTLNGAVNIADGNSSITVDGTVAATQSGTWNITNVSGTVSLPTGASTSANQSTIITALQLLDDAIVTDDAAFTVGTTKLNMSGGYAVAHGSNPDAADAGDAGAMLMNRHRIPFMLGGHPNLQSAEYITTAAQTSGGDNVLPLISAGTKYVITGVTVTASAANTVNTSVRLGFGTAGVPTQGASAADAVTKVILSHPGIAPGSGVSKGHAGGIVGIGGDGEELYIVCSVPTGGSVVVQVDYYTIES